MEHTRKKINYVECVDDMPKVIWLFLSLSSIKAIFTSAYYGKF